MTSSRPPSGRLRTIGELVGEDGPETSVGCPCGHAARGTNRGSRFGLWPQAVRSFFPVGQVGSSSSVLQVAPRPTLKKINRLRHRARRAFLSSEATSLCALTLSCWLRKCLAAFETALKTRHHLFFPHFPNPTRNETLSVTSVRHHSKVRSRAPPVLWHSCKLVETRTSVEEPPPLVRTRPQHVTARRLLAS
jgi:hypothetical protein